MLITKKMLLAIALIAALVGGGLGALITNSSRTEAANDSYQNTQAANTGTAAERDLGNPSQFNTSAEQVAYREGFEEGYNSCASAALGTGTSRTTTRNNVVSSNNYTTTRARRVSNNSGSRRVYYDYETQTRPKGRSFWSKHRDKLTMAIGTGTGAATGGLAGGKKGAGIGALVGLGGSALYTYKLRKRSPRY